MQGRPLLLSGWPCERRGGVTRERIDVGALLRGHGRAIGRPGAPFIRHSRKARPMHFLSERQLDDGCLEREFTLGDIPGILWTPSTVPAPLILLGHPGGLRPMYP